MKRQKIYVCCCCRALLLAGRAPKPLCVITMEVCLSPNFRVRMTNPTPLDIKPRILSTAIDFDDGTASIDLALSVIDEFRITSKRAREIIREVGRVTAQWREEAKKHGLSKREIDRMASAFEHAVLTRFAQSWHGL